MPRVRKVSWSSLTRRSTDVNVLAAALRATTASSAARPTLSAYWMRPVPGEHGARCRCRVCDDAYSRAQKTSPPTSTLLTTALTVLAQIHYTRFLVNFGEVANLLRTCYGETGVVDFGLMPSVLELRRAADTTRAISFLFYLVRHVHHSQYNNSISRCHDCRRASLSTPFTRVYDTIRNDNVCVI